MATTIKLKRKTTAETPQTSIDDVKLEQGEPLFDTNTQTLYIGNSAHDTDDAQKHKNVSVDGATYLRSRDNTRTKLLSTVIDNSGDRYVLPQNDEDNDHFLRIGSASYPFERITVGKVKRSTEPDGTIKPQISIDGVSIAPNTDKEANIGTENNAFDNVYTQQNNANVIQTLSIPNADSTYSLTYQNDKNNIVILPALSYDGQLYPNRQQIKKYDNVYQIASNEQAKHFIVNDVEVFIAQVLNYITLNYKVINGEGTTFTKGGTYISTVVPSSRGTMIANVYSGTPISDYEITQEWTYTTDHTENQDPGPTPSAIKSHTITRTVAENQVTDTYHIGDLPPFCSGIYIGLDGSIFTFGTNDNQKAQEDKYWFHSGLVTSYIVPIGSSASIGSESTKFANIYATTFHGNVTGGDASTVTNVKEITGTITEIKDGATVGTNSGSITTNTGNIASMTGGTITEIKDGATVGTNSGSITTNTGNIASMTGGTITEIKDGATVGTISVSVGTGTGVAVNGDINGDIKGDVTGTIAKAKQIQLEGDGNSEPYSLSLSGTTLTLAKAQS